MKVQSHPTPTQRRKSCASSSTTTKRKPGHATTRVSGSPGSESIMHEKRTTHSFLMGGETQRQIVRNRTQPTIAPEITMLQQRLHVTG